MKSQFDKQQLKFLIINEEHSSLLSYWRLLFSLNNSEEQLSVGV